MTTPSYNAPYPGQPQSQAGRGPAIGSLVLGIIAIILSPTVCLSWLGIILGIVGVILGVVGLVAANKVPGTKKGMAIGGIVTSIIAILIGIVAYAVIAMWGGRIAQLAVVEGNRVAADALAAEARANGVEESVITSARAELDAVLNSGTDDMDDMEAFVERVEDAMRKYEQTLDAAAEETGGDDEMPTTEPSNEDGETGGAAGE